MTELIEMRRGDTLPDITIACVGEDEDGTAIVGDLSGATEVLIIASQNRSLLFSRTTAARPVTGILTHSWVAGDTDALGIITLEVQATWSPDRVLTFRAPVGVNVLADNR
jgi:hypothetical protein